MFGSALVLRRGRRQISFLLFSELERINAIAVQGTYFNVGFKSISQALRFHPCTVNAIDHLLLP